MDIVERLWHVADILESIARDIQPKVITDAVQAEVGYSTPKPKVLYSLGDTVTLKSGGPVMTVIHTYKETAKVECMWFNDTPLLVYRDTFPTEAIQAWKA